MRVIPVDADADAGDAPAPCDDIGWVTATCATPDADIREGSALHGAGGCIMLDRPLGEGATGTVFAARILDGDGGERAVAFKRVRIGTTHAQRRTVRRTRESPPPSRSPIPAA